MSHLQEVAYQLTSSPLVLAQWLLLLLVPLLLLLHYYASRRSRSSRRHGSSCSDDDKQQLPPSPPGLPIIGHLHLIGDLPHVSLRDLSAKHGRDGLMLLHLGAATTLIVSSPQAAETIMRTHDHVFASRLVSTVSDDLMYGSSDIAFSPKASTGGRPENWSPRTSSPSRKCTRTVVPAKKRCTLCWPTYRRRRRRAQPWTWA